MEPIKNLTCSQHSSSFLEVDLEFKVYCSECLKLSSKANKEGDLLKNLMFLNASETDHHSADIIVKEDFFCFTCCRFIDADGVANEHRDHASNTVNQICPSISKTILNYKKKLETINDLLNLKSKEFESVSLVSKEFETKLKETVEVVKSKASSTVNNEIKKHSGNADNIHKELESDLNLVLSKIQDKASSVESSIQFLKQTKVMLENNKKNNFSHCDYIRQKDEELKKSSKLLDILENPKEDEATKISKLNTKFEKYNLNIDSLTNYLLKIESNLSTCISTHQTERYHRLRRVKEYESITSKFLRKTAILFRVNKTIKLCGLGICCFKMNKTKQQAPDLKVPIVIKIITRDTNDSPYKTIYEMGSTLQTCQMNISLNPVTVIHFNKMLRIFHDKNYEIEIELEKPKQESYVDLWIAKTDKHDAYTIKTNNKDDLVFTFNNSQLESDFHEVGEGLISDLFYSI